MAHTHHLILLLAEYNEREPFNPIVVYLLIGLLIAICAGLLIARSIQRNQLDKSYRSLTQKHGFKEGR